ncbi:hypothetical protein PoB_002264600 [Plakobranchus ocellatus]|uniref:Uncharacterized protein n=1 Tax=Plakobranchus ocellatus TaxID=259542 RepID=A0AAV3ZA20_9GAST|nr:hypothetical protein PoB_002264600 [Plakobranchus ocellatus]
MSVRLDYRWTNQSLTIKADHVLTTIRSFLCVVAAVFFRDSPGIRDGLESVCVYTPVAQRLATPPPP